MTKENPEEENKELTPATQGDTSPAVQETTSQLGRGHEEESDVDDLEIPRAKLIQFTSDEAQTDDPDLKVDAGKIINSITREELENIFIPIKKFTNFIQWNPRKKDDPYFDQAFEPGEMVFQTSDRRDPRVIEGIKFGENGEPPKVTKYLNFLCCFIGHDYPLILSFSKTSIKAGKSLNSLTQFTGGDMFSRKYKLAVTKRESAGTKYFVMDVVPTGICDPDEFKTAEMWFNQFGNKVIHVHQDDNTPKTKGTGPEWDE